MFIIILYLFKPISCTKHFDYINAIESSYVNTITLHRNVRHHHYIENIDDISQRCTLHFEDVSPDCIDSIAASTTSMTSNGCIRLTVASRQASTRCIQTSIDEMHRCELPQHLSVEVMWWLRTITSRGGVKIHPFWCHPHPASDTSKMHLLHLGSRPITGKI